MTAFKERREALLRAYMIDINGDDETETMGYSIFCREERIRQYAARIEAGLPLDPSHKLTRANLRELADTDADAPTETKKRGRQLLAAKAGLPFAQRISRDVHRVAKQQAKVFGGGGIVVPLMVRQQFGAEPDLPRKWAEYVRSLASARSR